MPASAQHRLGRRQRVGKGHRAKSQFADKPFIVVFLFRGAIDLQIDFADGVLPSLATFGRRQRLAVENGLHASSQFALSERASAASAPRGISGPPRSTAVFARGYA